MSKTNSSIPVAIEIANSIQLFKFNNNESLDNIIKLLCRDNAIDYVEDKYALQFIRNQSDKHLSTKYVTEENRKYIIDGTELKLVYSPTELSRMINNNLQNNGDVCWALEKLAGHINDPVFVSKVFAACYPIVMLKVNSEDLPPKLFCHCLRTILGFLKFDFIQEVHPSLIKKLIKNIDCSSQLENSIIEYSFQVLEQSVAKNQYSLIANSIDIEDLLPHIWLKECPSIQESALTLINNIAYYCPYDEMKTRLLRTMNSNKFLSSISSKILYSGSDPSSGMTEQLYLYQTLILNLVLDRLDPFLLDLRCLPDAELVIESKRRLNFESSESELFPKFTTDSTSSSSRNSKEMNSSVQSDRFSNGSRGEGMYYKRDHLVLSFLNLEISELNKEIEYLEEISDTKTITQLLYDCIKYFSKNYRQNYQVSLCSEGCQNFILICQDVLNLIINDLLHIGELPVECSTTYYPLIFSATQKQPFMEELFCVAMWLFERTKREMKSRTYKDHKKVIKIMERKLKEGLSTQPKTYHELEMILRGFSYASMNEQWLNENQAKQVQFFKTSSAVKELRNNLKKQMIQLIKTQRINYIMKGTKFPVWKSQRRQKTGDKFWFACLSSNHAFIMYSTNIDEKTGEPKEMKSLSLRDVEEFIVGKKSPHLKDFKVGPKEKKEVPLGFSLVIDHNLQNSLDFVTSSREIYDYWVDALNFLFGRKMNSNSFREELNRLVDMELKVQLLDIEGIDCPTEPPPIPPLPDNFDFAVAEISLCEEN